MGKPLDIIVGPIFDVFDAIVDVVRTIWQEGIVEALGEIFAVFGIDDETIVTVNKLSIPVLGANPNTIVKKAFIKTALGMSENDAGFYKNYLYNFNRHKGDITSFYRYGDSSGYLYGLPEVGIRSTNMGSIDISSAINVDLVGNFTPLTSTYAIPSAEIYFKHYLQAEPYNYLPYKNTLSKAADNGVVYDDWYLDSVVPITTVMLNGFSTVEYSLIIKRKSHISNLVVDVSEIYVNEGSTVDVTITLNRAVPFGETLRVNLSYSGASGSEFSAPSFVDVLSEDVSATFTVDNVSPSQVKRLDIEISVSPTPLFESMTVWEPGRHTSVILVPTGTVALCVGHSSVQRGNVATVPVKLSGEVSGGLTVNWNTLDLNFFGAASENDDFNISSGTLTFAGAEGEVQTLTVITGGLFSFFDSEPFEIVLSNASNVSVVDDVNGVVRITNDSTELPFARKEVITDTITEYYLSTDRYLVATYHESSAPPEEWFYWLYKLSDNTYPTVEPEITKTTNLEMLPVAILRKNKQSINVDKNVAEQFYEDFGITSPAYKSTRNILRKLGLKVDDVIEAVEANPDIGAIDDAYVNFAMDPSQNNKVLSKLLWMHFYELIVVKGIVSTDDKYSVTFEEQDVNNAFAWSHHKYTSNQSIFSTYITLDLEFNFSEFQSKKVGEYFHQNINGLVIYKKVNDFTVDMLEIYELGGMSAIAYDGYHNIAFTSPGSDGFTIPISWYILNKLSGPEVLELFPYIFRLDLYAIQVTELNWYETPEFALFFEIAMYVITAYSLGTAGSLISAFYKLLVQYAIGQIVIYIAELTGNPELAAVVGIVASLYIGSKLGTSFDLSTAEGLTNVVTAFSSSLGSAQTGEMKQLQEDLDELMDEFEKQKEFQEKNEYSSNAIGGAEYWSLKSSDTHMYESREIQFNFDLLFDYDNIISNFYDQQLTVSPK